MLTRLGRDKKKSGFGPHPITLKPCAFCGEIIPRNGKSPAQYYRQVVYKKCASMWAAYKTGRGKIVIRENIPCAHCGKIMNRRPKELIQSWNKRIYCDKSCAAIATNKSKRYAPKETPVDIEVRSGIKRYIPGSPEFNRIAAQYLERGF